MSLFFSYLFLSLSILSPWIRPMERSGVFLFSFSLLLGFLSGSVQLLGLFFILTLFLLWRTYLRGARLFLFFFLIVVSLLFKMKVLPGFTPYPFTPQFAIGLDGSLIGVIPLLLFAVPLAHTSKEWISVVRGLLMGVLGIALLAVCAFLLGIVQWEPALPPFPLPRLWSNLFLTSIPEEVFFRGFLQRSLHTRWGLRPITSLGIVSLFFTATHLLWSPTPAILGFVFLASLLYGGVYLFSQRIESSILTHFLLNFFHMSFFSYHAA